MDFDGDGRVDILSGSWPGQLFLFSQSEDGRYQKGRPILDDEGKAIRAGNASTAFAVDWDQDGDLDILSGTIKGKVVIFRNAGSRQSHNYLAPKILRVNGDPLHLQPFGGDANPVAADWDDDGDLDIVVSTGNGSVYWFKNTGQIDSDGMPILTVGKTLIKSIHDHDLAEGENQQLTCGTRTKICVNDYNGDGRLDLIVGDLNIEKTRLRDPLTDSEKSKKRQIQLQLRNLHSQIEQAMDIYRPSGSEWSDSQQQTYEREYQNTYAQYADQIDDLYKRKHSFVTHRTQRHGWVWVFLRRPGYPADDVKTARKR